MSSIIPSARSAVTSNKPCFHLKFVLLYIESGDGRTCVKTMITTGRDCGWVEWINNVLVWNLIWHVFLQIRLDHESYILCFIYLYNLKYLYYKYILSSSWNFSDCSYINMIYCAMQQGEYFQHSQWNFSHYVAGHIHFECVLPLHHSTSLWYWVVFVLLSICHLPVFCLPPVLRGCVPFPLGHLRRI